MLPIGERLVRKTAPAVDAVTLAECKAHMRITSSADDTYLQGVLDAALSFVDAQGALGRAMVTQVWYQWADANPGSVRLLLGPVQSVDGVSYYDADGALQSATLSDFAVRGTPDATTIAPKAGFSWPSAQSRDDAIRIEYTAGFGDAGSDVPAGVRHAVKLLVAHWEQQRQQGVDAAMYDLPFGFNELIAAERRSFYG